MFTNCDVFIIFPIFVTLPSLPPPPNEPLKSRPRLGLNSILEFNSKARPRSIADKRKKNDTYESVNAVYEGRELPHSAFKSKIFPLKLTQG